MWFTIYFLSFVSAQVNIPLHWQSWRRSWYTPSGNKNNKNIVNHLPSPPAILSRHSYRDILWYIIVYVFIRIKSTRWCNSPFHKTLSKSSLQMPWISVRSYEIGDMWKQKITLLLQIHFYCWSLFIVCNNRNIYGFHELCGNWCFFRASFQQKQCRKIDCYLYLFWNAKL